ncbi:division protein 1-related [Anaeramoeba flamelloides]|uniref:Division protein 1-related n=1 Tax=Anaeramoeba flamelloides TaxID=1746091 RepID=A0AAV8ADE1_9EUKA|nr:division protein 1-related [Anaeramoeba flamelloides]
MEILHSIDLETPPNIRSQSIREIKNVKTQVYLTTRENLLKITIALKTGKIKDKKIEKPKIKFSEYLGVCVIKNPRCLVVATLIDFKKREYGLHIYQQGNFVSFTKVAYYPLALRSIERCDSQSILLVGSDDGRVYLYRVSDKGLKKCIPNDSFYPEFKDIDQKVITCDIKQFSNYRVTALGSPNGNVSVFFIKKEILNKEKNSNINIQNQNQNQSQSQNQNNKKKMSEKLVYLTNFFVNGAVSSIKLTWFPNAIRGKSHSINLTEESQKIQLQPQNQNPNQNKNSNTTLTSSSSLNQDLNLPAMNVSNELLNMQTGYEQTEYEQTKEQIRVDFKDRLLLCVCDSLGQVWLWDDVNVQKIHKNLITSKQIITDGSLASPMSCEIILRGKRQATIWVGFFNGIIRCWKTNFREKLTFQEKESSKLQGPIFSIQCLKSNSRLFAITTDSKIRIIKFV